MLKTRIIFFLTLSASLSIYSQTESERKKISESYDVEAINLLKAELHNEILQRERRVSSYLKNNKTAKIKYKTKGKTSEIYDVIDGKPIYITTENLNSAIATKTNKLHSGGSLGLNLDGQNMIIGVWDAESALGTHIEFKDDQAVPQSRVVYPEFGGGPFIGTVDDHATHVAGTLIAKGNDPAAKGMAPKATLRSFDWSADSTEALTEAQNGLLLSNHSYSYDNTNSLNRGAYTSITNTWDQISYQTPYYLMVCAAGNNGSDNFTDAMASGYDQIPGGLGTCKNNITVANASPNVFNGTLLNFPINSSSSRGPSDDFRVKPDIAADGTTVYSSVSAIPSGSTKLYDTYSGTSMASPNVAGTLLLLQQYYNQLNASYMRSATLKALVCHTALDDIAKVGPDPTYGWGLLNAEAAALAMQNDKNGIAAIKEYSLSNGNTFTYQFTAAAGSKLQATICWTDPEGTVLSGLNNTTPRLVNDLDLRLEDQNSTVFTPWKLDTANILTAAIKGDNTVDNIERIDINTPDAGNYTLSVTHKGTLVNDSQAFSLIITGANLTLNTSDKLIANVSVWPNPVNDKLNFSFKPVQSRSQISLYNILGKIIYQEHLETYSNLVEHSIRTELFSKGIYFLNIQNGNNSFNKKIIII